MWLLLKEDFSGEPTSCHDLLLIGHYLNGYYLIKSNNEDVGPVFWNFNEPIDGIGIVCPFWFFHDHNLTIYIDYLMGLINHSLLPF